MDVDLDMNTVEDSCDELREQTNVRSAEDLVGVPKIWLVCHMFYTLEPICWLVESKVMEKRMCFYTKQAYKVNFMIIIITHYEVLFISCQLELKLFVESTTAVSRCKSFRC